MQTFAVHICVYVDIFIYTYVYTYIYVHVSIHIWRPDFHYSVLQPPSNNKLKFVHKEKMRKPTTIFCSPVDVSESRTGVYIYTSMPISISPLKEPFKGNLGLS